MKRNIMNIYRRDMKNILSNWVALVVTAALILLPALYAWFNVESAWDPYGNTQGILVAVVNNDRGASFRGEKIDAGKDIVKKLGENKNIGWRFVDEKDAEKGVKYGKYYASITIPENFSERILSITQDVPQKAELIYSVNEKRNAVAPKITQKGVSNVQQEVNRTFIETVSSTVFEFLNRFGIQLEQEKPVLKSVVEMILELDAKMPEINRNIDEAYNAAVTLQGFIQRVQADMPVVADTIKRASEAAKTAEGFLIKTRDALRTLSPFIKQQLILARDLSGVVETIITGMADVVSSDPGVLKDLLTSARDRYNSAIDRIDNMTDFLNSLNHGTNNKVLIDFVSRLQSIKGRMQSQVQLLNNALDAIGRGEKVSSEILNSLAQGAKQITASLNDLVNNYDTVIAPEVDGVLNNSVAVVENTLKILQDAEKDLPTVNDLLQKAYTGTVTGIEVLTDIKGRMPAIQQAVHSTAERLRAFDSDERLNEVIRLLKRDAAKESEFLADPVDIKQNRIFPIPNYGSGMSPFFTTLSLWVGALISASILSVRVHPLKEGEELRAHEEYVGRYLTFMTIAILQAIVVTLGDMLLLKAYVADPIVFVLYGIYIGIVFTMIVYTLVSMLGNVGKALAMIFMVLQISASGGTFPIEVTPPFFRHVNPFLPFTYAVGGMREAVGGVLWDLLLFNGAVLGVYFCIFIVFGFLLKKILNIINVKFVEKFKESGLVEE